MSDFHEIVKNTTGISKDTQNNIVETLILILILSTLRFIILKIIWKKTENIKVRYSWKKSISYTSIGLFIILASHIWIDGFKTIGTFFGLLSAGIAIALKDLLANIAGWIFIITRRPFAVSDRIEINGNSGDVIDIRIFQFTLMEIGNWVDADQSTGRIIHIPNGSIFTKPVANYSKGFQFIWNEMPVLVTFESDWQKAKEILLKIITKKTEHLKKQAKQKIKEAASHFMINYSILTPTVYTSVEESGVELTLRYLVEPRKRRGSVHIIWEEILVEFAKHDDIEFAYPTQRMYFQNQNT